VRPEQPLDPSSVEVFRAERFPAAGPTPWLDEPDALNRIQDLERARKITRHEAEFCRKWEADGYIVAEGLIEPDFLDWVWSSYEEALASQVLEAPKEPHFEGDIVPGRVLNPHFRVPAINELMEHPRLVHLVELLLGAKSIPFQSISGHKASQQAAHSDSIHMTTYPQGFLVALWIAFEDIDPDSGPLVYYPGSHRLPYLYSKDVGIDLRPDRTPDYSQFDERYTPAVRRSVEEGGFAPAYFDAKKGDVLFWHANLTHGGSPRRNFTQSRKAFVFHYFAEGCICYHDLSGGPSWLHVGRPY
jgi:hypothetical protein